VSKGKDSEGGEEEKNIKSPEAFISKADKNLGVFFKAFTALGLLATAFAIISLRFYAKEESIDIFSHYSSWVAALPVFTLAVIFTALFFVVLVSFPVFSIYYVFHKLTDIEDEGSDCIKTILQFTFLAMLPGLLIVAVRFNDFPKVFEISLLYFGLVGYPLILFLVFHFLFKNVLLVSLGCFLIPLVSFVFFDRFFYFEVSFRSLLIWFVIVAASAVWLFSYSCDSDRSFEKGFVHVVLLLIVLLVMFITSFSTIISKRALHMLGWGGGVERVYYLYEDNKKRIPGEFINDRCCVRGFCFTSSLTIKWGVGELVYVDVSNDGELKQHIAIPRNILIPYKLDVPMPDVCKTQGELK
jgi:hypothetical protein